MLVFTKATGISASLENVLIFPLFNKSKLNIKKKEEEEEEEEEPVSCNKFPFLFFEFWFFFNISSPWLIYFVTGSLYLLISFTYFIHPPTLSPLATTCLLSVSIGLFLFCYVCSFVLFCRFHIKVKSHCICLSLTYFT